MLRIDIPNEVTDRLQDAFARLPARSSDIDLTLARLLQAGALLPVEVLQQLLTFRASPYAPTALVLTGLPVDRDLPPTPVEGVPEVADKQSASARS